MAQMAGFWWRVGGFAGWRVLTGFKRISNGFLTAESAEIRGSYASNGFGDISLSDAARLGDNSRQIVGWGLNAGQFGWAKVASGLSSDKGKAPATA